MVAEPGFTGSFTSIDTCHPSSGTIANFSPTLPTGPSATVTVTGVSAGTCQISYSDGQSQTQTVTINVVTAGIGLH